MTQKKQTMFRQSIKPNPVVASRPINTVLPVRMLCCLRCGNEQILSSRCDVCAQLLDSQE